MPVNKKAGLVYGLSNPLQGLPPEPIISTRNPTTTDKAEIGTWWVNKSADSAYILTSVSSNSATWTGTGVSGGINLPTGDIIVQTGDIEATAGDITAGGSIEAGTTLVAGTGLTVTTGGISVAAGSIGVTTGDLTLSAGDLNVSNGNVTIKNALNFGPLSGSITCDFGPIRGQILESIGDTTGNSGTVITNADDEAVSTGAGTVLMKTTNPGNSKGWLKIYVNGTTARWIPYWENISP